MRTGQPPIAAAASEDWQLGGRRLELSGPVQVMGILNVTPASFYAGGCHLSVDAAVARALPPWPPRWPRPQPRRTALEAP